MYIRVQGSVKSRLLTLDTNADNILININWQSSPRACVGSVMGAYLHIYTSYRTTHNTYVIMRRSEKRPYGIVF